MYKNSRFSWGIPVGKGRAFPKRTGVSASPRRAGWAPARRPRRRGCTTRKRCATELATGRPFANAPCFGVAVCPKKYKRGHDTKRRGRDLDQIQDDVKRGEETGKPMSFEFDDDLPGASAPSLSLQPVHFFLDSDSGFCQAGGSTIALRQGSTLSAWMHCKSTRNPAFTGAGASSLRGVGRLLLIDVVRNCGVAVVI